MKTVTDVIIDYLNMNQYDGLCNPDLECGCGVENLQPCHDPPWGRGGCDECVAAVLNDEGEYMPAESEDYDG